MNIDLIFGVISFSGIVLVLVMIIMAARSKLVSTGDVTIEINGDSSNPLVVPAGSKLLQTLADNKIFLSSACGGGGTCSQCKCQVVEGGGSILAAEESHFNTREKNEGWRLSCQVAVKNDLKINVPEEIFGVKEWECEVISNENVATFIKELVLKLPEGENSLHESIKDIMPYKSRNDIFKDKYYKLKNNDVSKTITAHMSFDCNMYIHPTQPRGLSPREAARLQTFPDNYIFMGPNNSWYRQIGNAVPVKLAEIIGNEIMELI